MPDRTKLQSVARMRLEQRPVSLPTRSRRRTKIHFVFRERCADLHANARRSSGTTGNPEPVTKFRPSSSLSLIAIADAVWPTMIGTIALWLSSGCSCRSRPARKYCAFARSSPTSSGMRLEIFDCSERTARDRRRERV